MATAIDVAEFILRLQGAMDTTKLQRLVYYSQALVVRWTGRPLFTDEIQAWANGPVIWSLFVAHRGQYSVIPGEIGGNPDALSEHEKASVSIVVDHYGKWSGQQLSNLTHNERPWQRAREGLEPTERSNVPIDLMEMRDT